MLSAFLETIIPTIKVKALILLMSSSSSEPKLKVPTVPFQFQKFKTSSSSSVPKNFFIDMFKNIYLLFKKLFFLFS